MKTCDSSSGTTDNEQVLLQYDMISQGANVGSLRLYTYRRDIPCVDLENQIFPLLVMWQGKDGSEK